MPQRKYAYVRGGPERVECSWRGSWENFTVRVAGEVVGTITDKNELGDGKEFRLPDSSTVTIQLENDQLSLYRNGHPLPEYNPGAKLNRAVVVIFSTAILTVINAFGVVAAQTLRSHGSTSQSQFVTYLILAGLLGFLGIMVRQRIRSALWLVIGLYTFDTVVTILAASVVSNVGLSLQTVSFYSEILQRAFYYVPSTFLIASAVIHGIALYFMCMGFEGLDALKRDEHIALGSSNNGSKINI